MESKNNYSDLIRSLTRKSNDECNENNADNKYLEDDEYIRIFNLYKLDIKNYKYNHNLANYLFKLKKYSESIIYFKNTAKYVPSTLKFQSLTNLAKAYFKNNEVFESIKVFEEYTKKNSDDFRGYFYSAYYLAKAKKYRDAKKEIEKCIKLNEDYEEGYILRDEIEERILNK